MIRFMLHVSKLMFCFGLMSINAFATASRLQNFEHESILGSSFKLTVETNASAEAVEDAVLKEIERLENILSTYESDSEVSRYNSGRLDGNHHISTDLKDMIEMCEQWRDTLPKAFSCRLGKLIAAWKAVSLTQERPDRASFRAIAKQAIYHEFTMFDNKGKLHSSFNQDFKWDFGAIGKGYILDRAMQKARETAPNALSIGIDIGGDAIYWQSAGPKTPWRIKLANPNVIDDSQNQILGDVLLHSGAIAYSGHSSRSIKIGRHTYSHILVPRDGWPSATAVSAVVIASKASHADAIATALTTMEVSEAIDWVNRTADVEALLISPDGRQYASYRWQDYFSEPKGTETKISLGRRSANIAFQLKKPLSGITRKPYVSLWLENSDKQVVRNLLLLGQSQRWMSNNTRWWRKQGRSEPSLLEGFARPTRRAGNYQVIWDGLDDYGKAVENGDYTLIIEAVREHGDHEKISLTFEFGGKPQSITKTGKREINRLQLTTKKPELSISQAHLKRPIYSPP